jgi:uronate dehydrogenase
MVEGTRANDSRLVVLTGAAGRLGTILRKSISAQGYSLRSCDINTIAPPLPGEDIVLGDLRSAEDVTRMVAGADTVVHFGGVPEEDAFEVLLPSNIVGNYNVFEQARRAGVRRIVFASSNHATGFHEADQRLDASSPPLPDTLYGVTKVYGEALGALYAYKYGIEVACLRIGACWPKPRGDLRDLAIWLSHADLARLVDACLASHAFQFEILYGVSKNKRGWWDNSRSTIDYRPLDDAENFAAELAERVEDRDTSNPAIRFQGGSFAADGYVARGYAR